MSVNEVGQDFHKATVFVLLPHLQHKFSLCAEVRSIEPLPKVLADLGTAAMVLRTFALPLPRT